MNQREGLSSDLSIGRQSWKKKAEEKKADELAEARDLLKRKETIFNTILELLSLELQMAPKKVDLSKYDGITVVYEKVIPQLPEILKKYGDSKNIPLIAVVMQEPARQKAIQDKFEEIRAAREAEHNESLRQIATAVAETNTEEGIHTVDEHVEHITGLASDLEIPTPLIKAKADEMREKLVREYSSYEFLLERFCTGLESSVDSETAEYYRSLFSIDSFNQFVEKATAEQEVMDQAPSSLQQAWRELLVAAIDKKLKMPFSFEEFEAKKNEIKKQHERRAELNKNKKDISDFLVQRSESVQIEQDCRKEIVVFNSVNENRKRLNRELPAQKKLAIFLDRCLKNERGQVLKTLEGLEIKLRSDVFEK